MAALGEVVAGSHKAFSEKKAFFFIHSRTGVLQEFGFFDKSQSITWEEQHLCFDRLRDLIRQRTPVQVARMEAQRGLVISPPPVENPIAAKFHTL